MKKIIIALFLSSFLGLGANADSTNVGLSMSSVAMDASGSHTTNSETAGSLGGLGAAVTANSTADFLMGSLFAERQVDISGPVSIAIGLNIIPVEAEIDTITGGDGFDATLEVSDVMTLYIQPMFAVSDSVSLYVRAGLLEGDLNIKDTLRQTSFDSGGATDGNTSKSLEGVTVGGGVQVMSDSMFVRLETMHTNLDPISHTNSNKKVIKADAEMDVFSLSIGKSF
ncbi:hypothetical protein N9S67_02300 [Candidatus Pelagibacter sp.]|nr:hypothetical protein [Candidatus Pelagibacter sp.]